MSHINSVKHLGKTAIFNKNFDEEIVIHGMNLLCFRPDQSLIIPKYAYYFFNSSNFFIQLMKYVKKSVNQASFSIRDIKNIELDVPSIKTQKHIVDLLDKAFNLIHFRKQQINTLSELKKSIFLDTFGDPRINNKQWNKVKIKKIADNIKQINPKKMDNTIINYIDISSINNKNNKIEVFKEYLSSEAPSRARQEVQLGDILVSTVRPNLKNIAKVKAPGKFIASSGFCVIRPNNVNGKFLFELIKLDYFSEELSKLTTGANYPAIKKTDVLNQEVILPPFELQNHFSNKVEMIDNQIKLLTKSLKQFTNLYDSLLQKSFSGELFNEEKINV